MTCQSECVPGVIEELYKPSIAVQLQKQREWWCCESGSTCLPAGMSWPKSLSPVETMRISLKLKIVGSPGSPVELWSRYLDFLEPGLGQKILGGFDRVEG